MSRSHRQRAGQIDPRSVMVHLSSGVKSAFADLAGAVHFNEDFDGDALNTLKDLAAGKVLSVDDLVGSFPLIAEHVFKHIHSTGDERAAKAWREVGSALLEKGFTLAKSRVSPKLAL